MPDEQLGRAAAGLRGARRGRGRLARRPARAPVVGPGASWQLPDAFAFIDEVPKTSVGKFDKKVLRRRLAEGELAVERSERDAVS